MWSKPPGRRRSSSPFHRILRPLLLHIFILECAAFVFLMYLKPTTSFGSGLVKILAPNDQVNSLFSNESNKGVTSVLIYNLNGGILLCNIEVSTSLTTRTRTRSLIGSSFTMDTHHSRGQLQRPVQPSTSSGAVLSQVGAVKLVPAAKNPKTSLICLRTPVRMPTSTFLTVP